MDSTVAASRAFLGVDADLWVALGTFTGPLVAVLLGLLVFRVQQQSQRAADRFLTYGVLRLHGTLSNLLSIHLLNFQTCTFIIRTLNHYPLGHPLAPRPDDIPKFLGVDIDSLPLDSLLPVQELIGDKVVLNWALEALSDVTLEAKDWESQIRRPAAAYFGSDPATTKTSRARIEQTIRGLTIFREAWHLRTSAHFALLDRLNDLDREVAAGPWTFGGYYGISRRSTVGRIRQQIHLDYAKARLAHEQTQPWLIFELPDPPA